MNKNIYLVINFNLEEFFIESKDISEIIFLNYNDFISYKGNKNKFLLDSLVNLDICKVKNTNIFDNAIGSIESPEHYIILNKVDNLVSFLAAIKIAAENGSWSRIFVNISDDSLIFNALKFLGLNVESLQTRCPISDLDLLSEANYSTRRVEAKSFMAMIMTVRYQFIFKFISTIVYVLINWFGFKKFIFLKKCKIKSSCLILFSRYTSRASNFLPEGRIILCSRYWPKSLKLLVEAFFRVDCIIDVFINKGDDSLDRAWVKLGRKFLLDKDHLSNEINDIHEHLRLIAGIVLDPRPVKFLDVKLKKYNITDVISPFDSYYPVIKLLEECSSKGIKRHVIQHGIMDYPTRDFLFADMAYVFSKTLYDQLISKGYSKDNICHISNDLEISLEKIGNNNESKVIIGKNIYVVTSVLPIFSWLPMRTSLMENIYIRFIESIISMGNIRIPVTIVCHPAENIEVYKRINKRYGLTHWNVVLTLNAIKPIPNNSIFIDLGYSTVSVELAICGAVVMKYLPGITKGKPLRRAVFKNSFEYYEMQDLCFDLLTNKFSIDDRSLNILDYNICAQDIKINYLDKIESWLRKFHSINADIRISYE